MRPMSIWQQCLVLCLIAGALAVGWHQRAHLPLFADAEMAAAERPTRGPAVSRAIPVITAVVEEREDALSLAIVGTGRARRSVMLRAPGDGEITAMALPTGSPIIAGKVVIGLEDEAARLSLSLAETRLAEAERNLARQRQLSQSGTAAAARLDEALTATEIARLERERAVEVLSKRILRAPFDGVAGLSEVETGAWVGEGDTIASFDDRSSLLVEFDVPETALSRLAPGLAVTATTPSVPGRIFEGRIVALDSRVDASSRAARVRVELPNRDDILRPGVSFSVRLDLPGANYPAVPELALQFSRGSVHLWRLNGDQVERIGVRMVARRDGMVLVDGPLTVGERVVIEGTQRLRPGRRVIADIAISKDTKAVGRDS
ncbi:MAG: efflux RND transporter periplasmic adaptor subunit [Pseudomonadota bacterium]